MDVERGSARVGIGCGISLAYAVGIVVISVGGVLVPDLVRDYSGSGAGQGEGIIAGMLMLVAPVIALAGAWKPAVGIALGAVVLLALLALHVAAIVV
jgi:hypothetical protein